MQRLALSSVLVALGVLGLGCNSLTEPNQFKVQKEERSEAPAAQAAGDKPGAVVAQQAPAAQDAAPKAANQAIKAQPAKASPPAAPNPAGGSCGE